MPPSLADAAARQYGSKDATASDASLRGRPAAMTSRLANPAELERTAKRLDNGAAQLEHLRKALIQSARQPDWEGTAGDSMRTDLDGFAKEISAAERELRNMAHDLRVGANRVRDEREDRQHHE